MKIKLLQDGYDNDKKIFSKDEICEIIRQSENMLYIKEIDGEHYCLSKIDEGKYFTILKERLKNNESINL